LPQLIFFGQDAHDAAVQRRIRAFAHAGADVLAFTMRRGSAFETPWRNVDLGRTRDAAFAQRIATLAAAAPKLAPHREELAKADIFYARNLDMLALAHWAKKSTGSRARIVYECLDVHRFMTRTDAIGSSMRGIERSLLRRTALVVVSSPAFLREYFEPRHGSGFRAVVVENRLPTGFTYGERPRAGIGRPDGPIRIGWFGNLRCRRSLNVLLDLAERFPARVALKLRGAPTRAEFSNFEARVAGRANVQFGGRYAWPADLAGLYEDIDLVWAGDFHDAGANSRWLLPNRLYEGGYYGAPPIAPADSETGRWIEARRFGFTLSEPLEQTLPAFIDKLDCEAIWQARARLLAAPQETFLQPADELERVMALALSAERVREPA
jgi:succinoglycan biosynthesis protein ExoL